MLRNDDEIGLILRQVKTSHGLDIASMPVFLQCLVVYFSKF